MKKMPPRVILSAAALLALTGTLGWSAGANPDDHAPTKKPAKPIAKPVQPVNIPAREHAKGSGTGGHGQHAGDDDHGNPDHDDVSSHLTSVRPVKKQAKEEHDDAHEPQATEPKPLGGKKAGANATASIETPADADEALARLSDGNARWIAGKVMNPNSNAARREETAGGQHPFAAVLTCADSRLPVERLFDQGVGDLFVVRVAGNTAGTSETGTMEYGAEHLHVPLLVVMGHTKCGAVAAAAGEGTPEGALGELVGQVRPAVERAQRLNPELESEAMIAAAIKENVWQSIFTLLRTSPVLAERVQSGELKVVGAVCDVASGKVHWLGEHPWQNELVTAFAGGGRVDSDAGAHEPSGRTHAPTSKATRAADADDSHGGH